MASIITAISLLMVCASCTTVKPLCRHIVLSQYAACVDAGYEEVEIVRIKNTKPVGKFIYHEAVRARVDGKWLWADQPDATFRLTSNQPPGMIMRRIKNHRRPQK